jgi:carbonic anhydrase/acetyltransferase-like protein (isoleucine patch superfamily)
LIGNYLHHEPRIDPAAFVHPAAVVLGDVVLEAGANCWPGVVLRGDQGAIRIGAETNLQDGVIAHATGGLSSVIIGARVTVGHRAILHGCIVEDRCLVGMGSIVLDNARIGTGSVIGAGAVVSANTIVPPGSLVLGIPGRVVRPTNDKDRERIEIGWTTYLRLAREYREG